MCGNFALWYVICFRRGNADDVHFSRIISYDGLLDKATTPPFRQRLLRGTVEKVD